MQVLIAIFQLDLTNIPKERRKKIKRPPMGRNVGQYGWRIILSFFFFFFFATVPEFTWKSCSNLQEDEKEGEKEMGASECRRDSVGDDQGRNRYRDGQ